MIHKLAYLKYRTLNSFWFLPSLFWLGAFLLAGLTLFLDTQGGVQNWFAASPLFDMGAEGARNLLSTLAGSLITVTSLVFSLTLVTLTLASSQLGPRLIEKFISDQLVQVTLGSYISTFTYALLILRSVQGGETPFVPALSLHMTILGTLFCVGLLIAFIHHIATVIQADWVISSVASDLLEAIPRAFPEEEADAPRGHAPPLEPLAELAAMPVPAHRSGYVQAVAAEDLAALASKRSGFIRLIYRPGHYIVAGAALAYAGPRMREEDHEIIRNAFVTGPKRTATEDIEFAVSALVEIALRALSPGINDPRTAMTCTDWLTSAVACAMKGKPLPALLCDEEGTPRVWRDTVTFEGLVDAAYNEIRQAAEKNAAVMIRLVEALIRLAELARSAHHLEVMAAHKDRLHAATNIYLATGADWQAIEGRFESLSAAMTAAEKRLSSSV